MVGIVVDAVLGSNNPHHDKIEAICARLPLARLHVQTPHIAKLMALADCAINAGGSTTWERCTLGLPALVTIQSDNQAAIAIAVDHQGGHKLLGWSHDLTAADYASAIMALTPDHLRSMSAISASLCDGKGAYRVANYLLNDCLGNVV